MILTLSELKIILQIDDNTQDDLFELQLQILEDAIVDYTNNLFEDDNTIETITASFDATLKTITAKNSFDFVKNYYMVGDQIRVIGSRKNDAVYSIKSVVNNIIEVNEDLIDEDNDLNITIFALKYPKALKQIVADMVNYNVNRNKLVDSESISRHSITYRKIEGQYPVEIIAGLNKYCLFTS